VIPPSHRDKTSSQRKSSRPARDRLASALSELIAGSAPARSRPLASVAQLCRIANVSRNSLYRYHPKILQDLRQHQRQQKPRRAEPNRQRMAALRGENAVLRRQLDCIAALADHYYAAYRETLAFLARRDRELAELRRKFDARPTPIGR